MSIFDFEKGYGTEFDLGNLEMPGGHPTRSILPFGYQIMAYFASPLGARKLSLWSENRSFYGFRETMFAQKSVTETAVESAEKLPTPSTLLNRCFEILAYR